MLKTLSLFLSLFMLFQLQAFANNKDYYSKATATASGQGKVYVTKDATETPQFGQTNSVEQETKQVSSAPTHTYYFHAQPEDGKHFLGWYSGNEKKSEELKFTATVTATSDDQSKPTALNLTGRFGDKPYVSVKSDWATVTISSVTNKPGQKININTQQPWTIEGQVNMAYGFDGWFDQDGNLFSPDMYTEFTIDRELELEARWSLRPGQITGPGYYRVANMFNEYVSVVGDQDINFNTKQTSCAPDLVWFSHPRRFYYGYKDGKLNNAYAEPSLIIYLDGTLNEANYQNYSNKKTDVMTNITMQAQGVTANDHLKGEAEGRPVKITWSGANTNQYHLLAQVAGTYLAFKVLWGEESPAVMKNNSDTFDDLHFEAVNLDHVDTNWFAAFPDESMMFDGGYWSTMYTSFPYECYAPDGVEAYYVSFVKDYNGDTLAALVKIEDGIVPPHTPVLLKSPKVIDLTGYYSLHGRTPEPANRLIPLLPSDQLEAKAGEIAQSNCLRGTYQLATQTKTVFNNSMRVLGTANDRVGFYRLPIDTELRGNRAYLQLDEADTSAKSIRLVMADDVSGIEDVTVNEPEGAFPDGIFDLYGRKVEHPVPGNLYISNGRKFIAR